MDLHDEPPALSRRLPLGIAVLAAALGGLGLIFWIAANWDTLGRSGRFALLQGCVVVMCAGALWRPALRAPLGLLALLAIGGLFALFGQTYQTGADPWQLFALWAALALPLCLGARSDVLWAPFALIAMSGVSLWIVAHTGHQWRTGPQDLPTHLIGWSAAVALVAALHPAWHRFTGSGLWGVRTAVTLAVAMICVSGATAVFSDRSGAHYALALAVLGIAAVLLANARSFDIYGLSAVALGLNALLLVGLGHLLFDHRGSGDEIGRLLVLGLSAAGLLAASVSGVMRLSRRHARTAGAA
jgi:uncharacterized membrane protein